MRVFNRRKAGWGWLPIILFLGLWELAARAGIMPGRLLLPPFSEVLVQFFFLNADGLLWKNFLASLARVLIGFTIGSAAGIAVGTLMGWRSIIDKTLGPIISLFYPIPALGWIPLLMLWVGINELLPIILIFICSFFPILYNTVTGIKSVDRDYIRVARTLGASESRILFKVVLPLALPNIFTGLRLEAGMAWRTIIAAEMVAIPTGIGALLMKAESLMRLDIIIVCLAILAVMCLTFEKFFLLLEQRLTSEWR